MPASLRAPHVSISAGRCGGSIYLTGRPAAAAAVAVPWARLRDGGFDLWHAVRPVCPGTAAAAAAAAARLHTVVTYGPQSDDYNLQHITRTDVRRDV